MSWMLARLCLCLGLALCLMPRTARCQTGPTLDRPALSVEPSAEDGPPGPRLQPADVAAPPIRAGGSAGPVPVAPRSADAALDAEVARLRSRALAPVSGPGRASPQQANAAWVLGLLYLHGIGVTASGPEAAAWFARARDLGEPLAAAGLAWCEINGCSGPPDPAAARRSLAALRRTSPARAAYLQWLLEARMSPLQTASPGARGNSPRLASTASRALLARAAAGGDVQARLELGLALVQEGRLPDALEQFRAAAARSPAAAANAALVAEQLRPPSGAGAASPLPSSAAETFARAQRNHRGEGQPANFVEAIRLYRLAQSQGSADARKMLELIFSRPGPDGEVDVQWMQQLAGVRLSGNSAFPESPAARHTLRREPTALSDLLPPEWARYLGRSQVAR
ncbi:MAG: hypothetical protein JWQ72_396 [Polaromonas sp.]|nr:hypothetical protein [Polaromonas sp.]